MNGEENEKGGKKTREKQIMVKRMRKGNVCNDNNEGKKKVRMI